MEMALCQTVDNGQFTRLQPYYIKRERRTRTFPNTRESDNVQLKKNRGWNANGKVGVGTGGHSLLPLLRQPGGSHKNTKRHKNDKNGKGSKNGKDGENGKKKCSISESSLYMMNLLKSERALSHFLRKTCTCVVFCFFLEFRLQAITIPL